MSAKPPVSPSAQAERLIDHARKISQELYKFSVELSEQNREKAQQKLKYGKQVLNSLEQLPSKYFNSQGAGSEFLNIIYINYISVKPNLENALIDLEKRIDENQYFKIPEVEEEINKEEKNKETQETEWKSAKDLNENDYSSFLKDLIHAAEKEIEMANNNDDTKEDSEEGNEEESEEETEAESEEDEDENDDDNDNEKNDDTNDKDSNSLENAANNEN